MSRRLGCLIGILIAFGGTGDAANPGPGAPYLQNFNTQMHGAQAQNWTIATDLRGVVYIGNNEGILEFDGNSWRLIPVANHSIVRSLAVDLEGRVWVSAQDEIGYLEADQTGTLIYTSLLEHVAAEDRSFADVWRTVITDRGVYFSSRHRLFRWSSDQEMKVWKSESFFRRGYGVSGGFFVTNGDLGLVTIDENDRLEPIPGGEVFAELLVNAVLEDDNGTLLVGTPERGFFRRCMTSYRAGTTTSGSCQATKSACSDGLPPARLGSENKYSSQNRVQI